MINDKITLTLYDENDKPIRTLTRASVRWKVLKRVVKLTEEGGRDNSYSDMFEAMTEIVGMIFAGQATLEEIDAGARSEDIVGVIERVGELARKEKNANFPQGARR